MITLLIGLVAGAIGGVLFGRRNKKKIELALAEVSAKYNDLKAKVK